VFQNTTKTEGVARGVDINPNRGEEPRETRGVTGLSGKERGEFADAGYTAAGGARRGTVPQGVVDNLASGRPPQEAIEQQDRDLAIEERERDAAAAGVLDPEPSDPFDMSGPGGVFTAEERDTLADQFVEASEAYDEIGGDDRGEFYKAAAGIKKPAADRGFGNTINADGLAVDATNELLDRRRK